MPLFLAGMEKSGDSSISVNLHPTLQKTIGPASMTTLRTFVSRGALLLAVTAGVVMSAGSFSDLEGKGQTALKSNSLFGNYLAGRQARHERNTSAAADYYEHALQKDPGNNVILEQTFLLQAAAANWSRAVPLARKLIKAEKTHRIARLVLGVKAFKDGNFSESEKQFSAARKGPISDLTTNLSRAWVSLAANDASAAFKNLNGLKKTEWALFYRRYHSGLIADLAGRKKIARKSFAGAFEKNKRTLRLAEAYSRHLAHSGDNKKAIALLREHIANAAKHPISSALLAELESGKKTSLLVNTASDGLAEVYYGIGDALTGEGGVEIGTIYLQLALNLKPDFPLALRSLGEVHDAAKHYELAVKAYDRVSRSSPLWMAVQIRKAYDLNSLDRTSEAIALLERLADAKPDEIRPLDAMGSILRSHKRYKEAVSAYTRAIDLVKKKGKSHWRLFYARGVSYERLKLWPKAEADLRQAKALDGERALVLNYLGYSWVDLGMNLEEAVKLIRKAVKLKPGDGYFVDSLGWAHYRLGNFKEAAKELERAVELRPDDAVINDHLGDAYWRVGRRQEARYQWSQALTLDPEPKDADKMKLKLKKGLDAVSESKAVAGDAGTKAN